MRFRLLILAAALAGCADPGKDSHTEVFKTAQTAAADRLAQQLKAHKDLAVSLVRSSRPDVEAKLADGPAIAKVSSAVTGTSVLFSANVVGDPAAGIQSVWVTWTDPTAAKAPAVSTQAKVA